MPDATVLYLPSEQTDALNAARYLAECGVPIFLAQPALDGDGAWIPDGGKSHTGYHLPGGWQRTVADPMVLDRWRPGMAVCAVMGHPVDGLDLDPRSGSEESAKRLPMPRSYGRAETPSGGTHDLVASLGVRSRDGLLPGVDLKAGVAGDGGHGFLFLAPTVKLSKATGVVGAYRWLVLPDLDELLLVGPVVGDGDALRALLAERSADRSDVAPGVGRGYTGPRYADLPDGVRAWADAEVANVVDFWRTLLDEAAGWPDGARDAKGRGWDVLVRDFAWALAKIVWCPWSALEVEDAGALYAETLPVEMSSSRFVDKWTGAALVNKAGLEYGGLVPAPPWDGLRVERDQETVDVTNLAKGEFWLYEELGLPGTPLAGIFIQDGRLVHTPVIGEDGYVVLSEKAGDLDGPAQVRRADGGHIRSRVQHAYRIVRGVKGGGQEAVLFPMDCVNVATGDPYSLPNVRTLVGVTHTPMLRADGTVLDAEGYDTESGRLFIPTGGLVALRVPERPSRRDVGEAVELLLAMLADFPWNTEHDRANFVALLLTPLMRELVPPPYKMGVINAHQRGSGKSLLGWILRELHGGVLRADAPKDAEEFRKQITTILTQTTAPVVQWDNVQQIGNTHLDSLLTDKIWSDRMLGSTANVTARNDRLWICTGNNVLLRGDLVRRALWVSIDPKVPHPEARTDFAISDLKAWVRVERAALLRALLVLLRGWVAAGRPVGEQVGADDFSRWTEACRGVVEFAGIGGVVGHARTAIREDSDDDNEWADVLAALDEEFGSSTWTAAKAVAALQLMNGGAPSGMNLNARSVGRWLTNREGQWADGRCVRQAGVRENTKTWVICHEDSGV